MSIFLKALTTTAAKKLIISTLAIIVKRTDNDLDDELLKMVKDLIGE